jgi:cytoskeleton protein RodZ
LSKMVPSIGQTLRQAREERGVELSDVEVATKIRVKFLEAMESDRWAELPAPVYARGFLDIYGRYLGLDQKALLERYRETIEGEPEAPIPGSVIKPGTLRQNRHVQRSRSISWGPIAKVAAAIAALVVVGLVIAGSIGGSDDNGNGGAKTDNEKPPASKASGPAAAKTTSTTATAAGEVSVELKATAPVWVCLVDDNGKPFVDSQTLSANDARGPFSAPAFEMTFGNGSVDLTVDGEAQSVPPVAAPIGYRITPTKIRRLDPSTQPSCA